MMPIETVEQATNIIIIQSQKQRFEKELAAAKKEDLTSMIKYMPLLDRQYYKSIGL